MYWDEMEESLPPFGVLRRFRVQRSTLVLVKRGGGGLFANVNVSGVGSLASNAGSPQNYCNIIVVSVVRDQFDPFAWTRKDHVTSCLYVRRTMRKKKKKTLTVPDEDMHARRITFLTSLRTRGYQEVTPKVETKEDSLSYFVLDQV